MTQIVSEIVWKQILENKTCKVMIFYYIWPDISEMEKKAVSVHFLQIKDGEELWIQEHFPYCLSAEQAPNEDEAKVILL
jgi:hypothetical protein